MIRTDGISYDYQSYVHDSDRAALNALQAIPGFSAVVKGFMNIWNEPQARILNMSSRVKLGSSQLPEYYRMLAPICSRLGIEVPDLYLEMNVVPNAYTSGDNHPFIVITSGLLNMMPPELIPTVLAHECGHIACHHVLYLTMGRTILNGAFGALAFSRIGGLISVPLKMAFYYWMRCSEYSADRAAVLVDGSPDRMQEVCFRLAGLGRDIPGSADIDAFMDQAEEYRQMIRDSKWNKTLEYMILSGASHPLTAVRALECRDWAASDRFRQLTQGKLPAAADPGRLRDRDSSRSAETDVNQNSLYTLWGMFRPGTKKKEDE